MYIFKNQDYKCSIIFVIYNHMPSFNIKHINIYYFIIKIFNLLLVYNTSLKLYYFLYFII